MYKSVIAITGASGFIGSELVSELLRQGYFVIALVRKYSSKPIASEERLFDLTEVATSNLLDRVDILIHCAFIDVTKQKNAGQLNEEGSQRLISLANDSGVKKIIYFSSVSAHDKALSEYGISKWNIEKLLNPERDVVVKCSLVIGNGGLFKRMIQYTLKRKIVPVFNNGNQPMQVIAIDDLLSAIKTIIVQDLRGVFVLANNEQLTYKKFFQTVATHYHKKFIFLPLNPSFLKLVIQFAGIVRIKLPVSNENILGLQALRSLDVKDSLSRLHLSPVTLDEKLADISISSLTAE